MSEFRPMPKTPRLSREVVITEKIDGTNASVFIEDSTGSMDIRLACACVGGLYVYAGSRTRWITPQDDNFGFAAWVRDNALQLVGLGLGHHFGEWWGRGIQRGYGLGHRRFSLFNVGRWRDWNSAEDAAERAPICCHVVPVLYRGPFDTGAIDAQLALLEAGGSIAAPGFMDPEGIMAYHTAAGIVFKKTIKGDAEGKHAEAHPKKERPAKAPRNKATGGRRKVDLPINFPDRRTK